MLKFTHFVKLFTRQDVWSTYVLVTIHHLEEEWFKVNKKQEIIMSNEPQSTPKKEFSCETCAMRHKAETNPKSFLARLWRWHTTWCPGWKAYQAHLAQQTEK